MSATTLWLLAALGLAGLEMLTGTFYLIAIAAGLTIGALASALALPINVQAICAAIASIAAIFIIKRWKNDHMPEREALDADDVGQRVTLDHWIDEDRARVQYRGSQWDAVLAEGEVKLDQANWQISARHGATLIIRHTKP
jgi:membrane protein implicated in regulation of membrane protease activity